MPKNPIKIAMNDLRQMRARLATIHTEGPFTGIAPGDALRILYHGTTAALITVTRINHYSLEGKDGEFPCKVTIVGPLQFAPELRFYAELGPNRQTVLRDVRIRKEVRHDL